MSKLESGAPSGRGKVTIRDVAKAAGVSASTVSRAFARPDRVSAATTKRIFAAADELGYHEDKIETVPLRGRKNAIAIIVPDIANQFFSDLIRAVQRECVAKGFMLIVAESRESASLERESFDRVAPNVDGVILTSSRMPDAMVRKCAQTRPVVVANRIVRGVDSVVIDVTDGACQLAKHIAEQGYKRVTYIDGPATSWSVGVRWNVFSQMCAKCGITARRLWPGSPTFEGGYAFAQRYLEDPTGAVVAHNDLMAIGFIAAMRRKGYDCPEDFIIAGFDNDSIAQLSFPPLTSVRQSSASLGAEAAALLIEHLHGPQSQISQLTVSTSLAVRESTCSNQ